MPNNLTQYPDSSMPTISNTCTRKRTCLSCQVPPLTCIHKISSDTRMSSWGPATFTVGSSSVSAFPMAQFKAVGTGVARLFVSETNWNTRWITQQPSNSRPHLHKLVCRGISGWGRIEILIQISGARTLRIRTTEAFAGGRPQVTVNSFLSSAPAGT